MKKHKLITNYKKILADMFTPVNIYLNMRDRFRNCLLLESSDYHGNKNSLSFICMQPIASFKVQNGCINCSYPDGNKTTDKISSPDLVLQKLHNFLSSFTVSETGLSFNHNGLFGYTGYDAAKYFEDIKIDAVENEQKKIPEVIYYVYKYVIAIDHFKDELYIIENLTEQEKNNSIDRIESLISHRDFANYPFLTQDVEKSASTDHDFVKLVEQGKFHCKRGDVFQIVLSRSFSRTFSGDEFNVYRALRTVNPSPYMFYCDFGDFKIFGSSPEAQLVVEKAIASIFPIAGTFKRTGDDKADAIIAEKLKCDAKENAEHTMLVDLARNDLNRNCDDVKIETFSEVQFYSHVIHLVSKVTGKINSSTSCLKIAADCFPAGTLSGAPKHRAMQLIDKYEKEKRGFYGGCIGYISFNNEYNHAIMIRTFLSTNNTLFYQAGAGIVEQSDPTNELNEVNNKLMALRNAIALAETVYTR